jgi:hypothetical protein
MYRVYGACFNNVHCFVSYTEAAFVLDHFITSSPSACGLPLHMLMLVQVVIDLSSFQHNRAQSYDGAVGVYDNSEVRAVHLLQRLLA